MIPADLVYDTINDLYGLKFKSEDMVRTINGVSWFKIQDSEKSLTVKPGDTKLNDFKLNFALVISQYDDPITKYTKTKILPFNVNADGSVGQQIPESLLKIDFRKDIVSGDFYWLANKDEKVLFAAVDCTGHGFLVHL